MNKKLFSISLFSLYLLLSFFGINPLSGESAKEQKPSCIFEDSIEVSKNMPYSGILVYQRYFRDQKWITELRVKHSNSQQMRIDFIKPKKINGFSILRNGNSLWIKRIEKHVLERIYRETKIRSWRRLLKSGQWPDLEDAELLIKNYSFSFGKPEKIAGRQTEQIIAKSIQNERPHVHLWVDRETIMQLKYKRYSYDRNLKESFYFEEIDIDQDIPESCFNTDGLECISDFSEHSKKEVPELDFEPIIPKWLPEGFEKQYEDRRKGFLGLTHHMVFTDGLASLSLYQVKLTDKTKKIMGHKKDNDSKVSLVGRFFKWGRWIYFRDLKGIRISAFGDIPSEEIIKTLMKLDSKNNHP